MGTAPGTNDGPGELNYVMRDVPLEEKDGPVGGRNCVFEGNGSRSNGVVENVIQRVNGAVQAQSGSQLRHQPRVSAVCWEMYLPRRSLKVLLVEGDDSTRHVVSALLRNCGYEVTAATNGLQAWSILMDMTNHIDLVLTEVDMPYLSGIGLLCKVMSHKTCMNIPVIMMSSNDPIVLVLKCLSKGAVDFLVKPIRKNELKNLWQHVWRKYYSCSDSDSASESGIHIQKSRKEKNADESVHNTYSSNGNEKGCIDLNVRDGSDSGSGTQSTCIKQTVEVDKPLTMLPRNASVFPADSTCAQFIHPRGEADGNDPMTKTMTRCQKEDARLKANIAMGKDLEITVPRTQEIKHEYESEKVSHHLTCTKQDQLSAQEPKKENKQLRNNVLDLQSDKPIDELKEQAAGTFCLISNATNPLENVLQVTDRKSNSASYLNKATSPDSNLKRPRGIGDIGSSNYDDCNVPIRSPISSFSRYNNFSTSKNVTSGKVGSCTPVGNSGAVRSQLMNNFPSNSNRTPDQGWNDNSTNNKDIGSITGDVLPRLVGSKVKSTSITKFQKSSFFPPMQNGHTCSSEKIIPQKVVSIRGEDQQVQVQHHHHHHHYYHHHMHEVQEEQSHSYDEDMQLEKVATVSMQCGSSNVFNQAIEGSDRKYSSNGSGSGSKHGSNAPNGSNTDVNAGEADIKSENMVTEESGDCFGRGIENRRGINTARYRTDSAIQKKKGKCFIEKADSKSGRS